MLVRVDLKSEGWGKMSTVIKTMITINYTASQVAQGLRIHLQCRRHRFDPWVGKIPWGGKWQPTPVFLPEENPWTKNPRAGRATVQRVTKSQRWVNSWAWAQYYMCMYWSEAKWKSLSRVWLFVTPWMVAYQAPLSTGFSRQEYWSGLPFPSPGDLPNPGIEPVSPALQTDTLLSEPPGKRLRGHMSLQIKTYWK